MLRNGKLASPGPEVFLPLGRVNQVLAAELGGGQLSVALQDQLEVFVGLRPPPPAFDLRIADQEAAGLSAALAELFTAGQPWRFCRETVLAAYPVARRQRRERFAAVMAGQQDYSAAELNAELPDLRRTLAARAQLGG